MNNSRLAENMPTTLDRADADKEHIDSKNLENAYSTMHKGYMEMKEKFETLNSELKKEKELNDDLIKQILEITKNSNKLSSEYFELMAKYEVVRAASKQGLILEYKDEDKKFVPFMGNIDFFMQKDAPIRGLFTFSVDDAKEWFRKAEYVMSTNKKREQLLKDEVLVLDPDAIIEEN